MKEFDNLTQLHKYLCQNSKQLISHKRSTIKHADGIAISFYDEVNDVCMKSLSYKAESIDKIHVKLIINTTNLYDSHQDVHIPSIWNQSLKQKKTFKLLKQHSQAFEDVISREMNANTKTFTWQQLGANLQGNTQALMFEGDIYAKEHEYMFNQYKNGYVDNHSVGMQYVNVFLCVNSKESWAAEEKKNWDRYIGEVANPKDIAYDYFYAVTEAKIIEGSAVVFGSNPITPTFSVKTHEAITHNEPIKLEDIKQFINKTLNG